MKGDQCIYKNVKATLPFETVHLKIKETDLYTPSIVQAMSTDKIERNFVTFEEN
jgi:hypothetical protein